MPAICFNLLLISLRIFKMNIYIKKRTLSPPTHNRQRRGHHLLTSNNILIYFIYSPYLQNEYIHT